MDTLFADARNVITVVSLLTFIGIVGWAYVVHRGKDFDAAANLPFADEPAAEHVKNLSGSRDV